MIRRHRRAFLKLMLIAFGMPLVASCATSSITPAQVVTDCQNAITALTLTFKEIVTASPGAISVNLQTKIATYLADANSVLGGLGQGISASSGSAIVQQIETDINAIITVAASVALPEPFATALLAASVILPTLEAFVNSFIQPAPAPTVETKARVARHIMNLRAAAKAMTLTQAEATLAILAKRK